MVSNTGEAIDTCRIHIYKNKKRIMSLDPIMENYNEMVKYVINNINDTKIEIIR